MLPDMESRSSSDQPVPSSEKPIVALPKLYSEAGVKLQLKKTFREGYSKGMEESKLVVVSLEATAASNKK